MTNSMLDLVSVNENAKEREIISNVTITDISRLNKPALVPAREGDIIREEIDGIMKEYQLTKETCVGKKVPMDRYSVSFSVPKMELVDGAMKEVQKSYQFGVLRAYLPDDISDYVNRKANVILVKEVLTEPRPNASNPEIIHPIGHVFVNCVKVSFAATKIDDMLAVFAKLMAVKPTM